MSEGSKLGVEGWAKRGKIKKKKHKFCSNGKMSQKTGSRRWNERTERE